MDADSYKQITGFYIPTKTNTILSGLTIEQNSLIELHVRNLNKIESEFGFAYNDNNKLLFGFRNNNNNTALRVWIGNTEKNIVPDINDKKAELSCNDISEGIYRINGNIVATIPYTGTSFTGSISGFLNCSNIVFYKIKIENHASNSYEFYPVIRNSDGKVGFYNSLDRKFYPVENAVPVDSTIFNSVTSLKIPEGEVAKIEDKDGNILWSKKS